MIICICAPHNGKNYDRYYQFMDELRMIPNDGSSWEPSVSISRETSVWNVALETTEVTMGRDGIDVKTRIKRTSDGWRVMDD